MEKILYHPLTIILAITGLTFVGTADTDTTSFVFIAGLVVWLIVSAIRHKRGGS